MKVGDRKRGDRRAGVFELPEFVTLARQLSEAWREEDRREIWGTRPHKFVWYNLTPDNLRT
jgi:hypothetical protein